MSALTSEAVAEVDPAGMLADVLAQPGQVGDALWRVESAGIPAADPPSGLLVCGMGGSAVGGDLARAASGARATRPISTTRAYSPDPWIGEETLVLCASYSGDTEETLACFSAAGEAGARRVVVTTGGSLAEAAREESVPVIGVPAGFQPRAAVVYMTVSAIECAALAGAAPSIREEVERSAEELARLAAEWGPGAPEDSSAKRLAKRLHGTVPVFHGAGATAAVAERWKTQVNENAKLPAFATTLPDANHNEICAWEGAGKRARFSAVFLEDPGEDPRVARHTEATARLVEGAGHPVERVEARGRTATERLLSLVLLGDLVSVYLAVLERVDPTPVEPIERLKAELP